MARKDVKKLQTRLNNRFGYQLKIDGWYGETTDYALQKVLDVLDHDEEIKEPRTAHFCLAEFKCKDGTPVPQELWGNVQNLMNRLEVLRAELGNRPIYIRSAYRHLEYNRKIGSEDTSQHVLAKAADITVKGLNQDKVYSVADKVFSDGGAGIYRTSGFVHVDIRDGKERWVGN